MSTEKRRVFTEEQEKERWQELIRLHESFFDEHYIFVLESQKPSASAELRQTASWYAVSRRLWSHGIHPFLELLSYHLPDSLEHMLRFIYMVFSMMTLLYEAAPVFEDIWTEYLGDIGRYCMAVGGDGVGDREVWAEVVHFWYTKAADRRPTEGRLYHHLEIQARPDALKQLFYYAKSLSCVQPFLDTRDSTRTLFRQILYETNPADGSPGTAFVKAHAALFMGLDPDRLDQIMHSFLSSLDSSIEQEKSKWEEQGVYIAVANFAAMFGYASNDNPLRLVYTRGRGDSNERQPIRNTFTYLGALTRSPADKGRRSDGIEMVQLSSTPSTPLDPEVAFANAKSLAFKTTDRVLERIGDPHILPHVHVSLVFMSHIVRSTEALNLVQDGFPWGPLAFELNWLTTCVNAYELENENENLSGWKLPDDFHIRGLEWTTSYFPDDWFKDTDSEVTLQLPSMIQTRASRILQLAHNLAKCCDRLEYDGNCKIFSAIPDLELPHATIVCDTSFLLRRLEIFRRMANHHGWIIVIPISVLSDLRQRSGVGISGATSALTAIFHAVRRWGNVEILDKSREGLSQDHSIIDTAKQLLQKLTKDKTNRVVLVAGDVTLLVRAKQQAEVLVLTPLQILRIIKHNRCYQVHSDKDILSGDPL